MRGKMAVQNSGGKKWKKFNYCHIGQTKQKRDMNVVPRSTVKTNGETEN